MEQQPSPRHLTALLIGILLIPVVALFVVLGIRLGQPGVPATSSSSSATTTFVCERTANLTIQVNLEGYSDNKDGTFTVDYTITIKNNSSAPAVNVVAHSILSRTCQSNFTAQIVRLSSSTLSLNPAYNGTSVTQLLATGSTIAGNSTHTITLRVRVPFTAGTCPVNHRVTISGRDLSGCATSTATQTATATSRSSAASATATGTGTATTSLTSTPVTPSSSQGPGTISATSSLPTQDSDEVIFDLSAPSSSSSSYYLPPGAK